MKAVNIIKYPGSKSRLAQWICSLMPKHKVYLEPFFGGGAVFFNKDSAAIETINDIVAGSPAVKNYLITADNDIIDICAELSEKGYNNLKAVIVSDNNMMPSFMRGDIAIYSESLVDRDGIYFINDGGSMSIRRLQFLRQEDAVLVISDNPQYQPRRLPLSKIGDFLTIEGRVVCRVLFE